ncbi:hypothetical protein [Alkalihalobacillus deserti]|nr:hypothetical protein [Alkalihalobacillus deserti]
MDKLLRNWTDRSRVAEIKTGDKVSPLCNGRKDEVGNKEKK